MIHKEPFLINPARKPKYRKKRKSVRRRRRARRARRTRRTRRNELMIINRPKRTGGGTMARRKRRTRKRRRSYRRNAAAKPHRLTVYKRKRGGVTVSRRAKLVRRSRGMVLNPFAGLNPRRRGRRRRRTGYRRNPVAALAMVQRTAMGVLPDVAGVVGGFTAVRVVPQYVFPANWQVGTLRYVARAIVIGVSFIGANALINKRIGRAVLIGGLAAVGTELLGQLLVKIGAPLSDVISMGAYVPPEYIGAYIPRNV